MGDKSCQLFPLERDLPPKQLVESGDSSAVTGMKNWTSTSVKDSPPFPTFLVLLRGLVDTPPSHEVTTVTQNKGGTYFIRRMGDEGGGGRKADGSFFFYV